MKLGNNFPRFAQILIVSLPLIKRAQKIIRYWTKREWLIYILFSREFHVSLSDYTYRYKNLVPRVCFSLPLEVGCPTSKAREKRPGDRVGRIIAAPRLIASLDRIITPLGGISKIISHSDPSRHLFFFFYPLPVALKWSLIQQNWSVRIQALTPRILTLKINQRTKFRTLRKPMFSLFNFDVIIFWFDGIINQNF